MSFFGDIAGAAVGAVGDLVGGLIGSHRSKKNNDAQLAESRRQFNINTDESIQRRVKDALKAGINPLAALGANVGSSPTIHAGGGSDDGSIWANTLSNIGNRFQRALEDKQADDMEFDTQAKELSLEEQRLRNRILRQEIQAKTNKPGEDMVLSMQGEGTVFKPIYDLHGRPRLVVNQDFLEGDSDNAGYSAALASALADGQIDKLSGRIISPQLRMMIDDYYYNTTGHHIHNLEELYISPSELTLANANAAEQSGILGGLKRIGRKLFLKTSR